MAQISLKNYLAKLESLLDEASADEVIQHSRHLLKYFPKNATVFRSLGLGLLLNGRWQEAESALRRVLTALPDDYRSHLGLSEVYTTLGRGDQAISHLERAFEQSPNSRELIDGLRGLYRRFRQMDRVKIQITTGAIARQHRRNGSPQQAITVLRSALERMPGRLDLSLLLADTLWETGAHVEAAEIAVDILKYLPDCVIANQIMTRLWLDAHRPTDAARYLSRIEAVDPILAYEIVQGPVPDNAFMVDEIDSRRAAQTELVSRRPDWLQSIGVSAPVESAAASVLDEEQPAWLAAALSAPFNTQTRSPAPPPIEADDDDWMATVRTPSLTRQLDLPTEFSSGARDINTGELEALFGQNQEELLQNWTLDDAPTTTPELDDEQPSLDDFTFDFGSPEVEAEPEPPPAIRDSRPAWMVDDSDKQAEPDLGVMGSEAVIHEDIPDWMHDAMFAAEADDSEDMDWLKDELFDSKPSAELKSELGEADSLDWLTAGDTEAQAADGSTTEDENRGDADESVGDSPFGEADAQPVNAVEDDWLNTLSPDAPAELTAGWLTDLPDIQGEDERSAAFLADDTESSNGEWNMSEDPQLPESNEDSFDWLSSDDPAAGSEFDLPELDSIASGEDDLPDWMKQPDEEASLNAADIPDWLLQDDTSSEIADDEDAPETEIGWISEFEPTAEDAEEELSWLSESDSESNRIDLYEAPMSPASETPIEPADEFSWLSEKEAEPVDPDQTPDWLVALEEAGEQGRQETKLSYQPDIRSKLESTADIPDWLASLQPDTDTPAATDEAMSAFDIEPEPTADTPDWLASLQPDSESSAVEEVAETAEETFGWYDEAKPEEETTVDETPDWLREISRETEEESSERVVIEAEVPADESESSAEADQDHTVEPEPEDEIAAITPAQNAPDWLNAMVPGLDVDYEAREDEIVEEMAAAGTSRRDYEWVVALVEKEAALVEPERAYPRFVFTRQPAWLIPPTSQTAEQDDDLPEWPTDQEKDTGENDDMPEWLR